MEEIQGENKKDRNFLTFVFSYYISPSGEKFSRKEFSGFFCLVSLQTGERRYKIFLSPLLGEVKNLKRLFDVIRLGKKNKKHLRPLYQKSRRR